MDKKNATRSNGSPATKNKYWPRETQQKCHFRETRTTKCPMRGSTPERINCNSLLSPTTRAQSHTNSKRPETWEVVSTRRIYKKNKFNFLTQTRIVKQKHRRKNDIENTTASRALWAVSPSRFFGRCRSRFAPRPNFVVVPSSWQPSSSCGHRSLYVVCLSSQICKIYIAFRNFKVLSVRGTNVKEPKAIKHLRKHKTPNR